MLSGKFFDDIKNILDREMWVFNAEHLTPHFVDGGLKKNQLHNHSHDLYSVRCKPSSVVYRLCEVREHLKKKTAYIFSMMMAEWWHLENEMLVVCAHALVPNCHMKCTKFFFHRKIFDVSSADELLTYLKQSNESFLNKRWKA